MHVASSLNIPGKGFDFSLVSIELIIFFHGGIGADDSWRILEVAGGGGV